ncbi:unnamed protein product [Prorocentrum cordatum]|uniref:Uncharacterized protein n=1 Tax=Prorocentrum cordatum TaxID=2364126 RepID=A0ABN9XG81_9DINO|nr:unnamed protein product [Polarella glacialis]
MAAPSAAAFAAPLALKAPAYHAQPPPATHADSRAPRTQQAAGGASSLAWLAVGSAAGAAAAAAQRRRAAACRRARCGKCGCGEKPPTPAEAFAAEAVGEGAPADAEEQFVLDVVNHRTRRGAATFAALSAAALLLERPAEAAARCLECAGEGIQDCGSCRGSGQFKMYGDRGVGEGMSSQYIECPDCYGSGLKLCSKCSGTGLPAKRLVGFLRDPAFRQFVARIQSGRVDVDNVPEIQAEMQEMVAIQERNRALKLADEAMKKEGDNGWFKLPNFF